MLIDIPSEQVSKFIQVLGKELDQSLFIINFIETCHKWKRKNDQLQVSLLYTESSMQTGVFVGILESGCRGPVVTLYAFDGYENDLEKALGFLQLDWNKVVNFEGICQKHGPIVEKLVVDKGLKIKMAYPLVLFSMPIKEALKIDIKCPDDVIFAPLSEHHADEMYKVWISNDLYTVDALKNAIEYNKEAACGIFCKYSGELLARCVRSHAGVVFALQTVEKAQNKGYGKLLLKYVTKTMAENDILPCSYVADINSASLNVHKKTGYTDVSRLTNYNMELEL